MAAKPFDPVGFWRARLADTGADLDDVGHRALGMEYNAFIYRRREEVLGQTLPSLGIELEVAKILEVGCGSGYWVKRWEEFGVDDLVGFDLSSTQIDQLRTRFPDYRFVQGDITTAPRELLLEGRFDILTLEVLGPIPFAVDTGWLDVANPIHIDSEVRWSAFEHGLSAQHFQSVGDRIPVLSIDPSVTLLVAVNESTNTDPNTQDSLVTRIVGGRIDPVDREPDAVRVRSDRQREPTPAMG